MFELWIDIAPGDAKINNRIKAIPVKVKNGRCTCRMLLSSEYRAAKEDVRVQALQELAGRRMPLFPEGPVEVKVVTYYDRRVRQAHGAGLAFIDVDATAKCVLDGLGRVVYADDSQVSRLVAEKQYDKKTGIRVTVTPISEGVK